jgi:3-deoxy-D-manno-octulosonic-acid transferase
LLLAPRHPERCELVEQLLRESGLRYCRHSTAGQSDVSDCDVFLIDTLGELNAFYGSADIAFVGGSLVPIGGHNLLEPAAHGLPILTGPHNFNSEDVLELLVAAGAAEVVADERELQARVESLLTDPAERQRRGALGRDAVAANRGAVRRLLEFLQPLLAEGDAGPSAPAAPGSGSSALPRSG